MAFELKGKPVLVISECQRGVIERGMGQFVALIDQVEQRGIVPKIADLAAAFRAAGQPVIHAPIAHRQDFADIGHSSLAATLARKNKSMMEGTPDVDIVDELTPQPGDIVAMRSSGMIAFNGTSLDAMLRRMRVDTVVLAGVSTNLAIAGCAIAASDFGYHVVIAEDCIAGSDPEVHRTIVNEQMRMIARISSSADIKAALPAAAAALAKAG